MDTHLTVWTIGHSNRGIEEFLSLLKENRIELLVDIRKLPGSKRNPQFNSENLERSLAESEIEYAWLPELGGLRKPKPDSQNTAWRNESFRGYADYMDTEAFHDAIDRLMGLAREKRTAIVCSEVVWWRCHRGLVADYLKSIGVQVLHILSESRVDEHPYTPAAKISEGKLSYRGDA